MALLSPVDEEKKAAGLEPLLSPPTAEQTAKGLRRLRDAVIEALRPTIWHACRNNTKELRKTAHLDGLRGFAALLVWIMHTTGWAHAGYPLSFGILEDGFGYDGNYYFIAFPVVRTFFSGGHFAVAIFFILSGYVLSLAPMAILHSGDKARLLDSVCSALFRRWIRLYLPVLGVTFVWMSCWHIFGIRANNNKWDAPESNYLSEVWKWYCDFKNFSFIFNEKVENKYNDHTWTIPLEMRGSIVVYTCILAFARCRTSARLALEATLVWYFMYIVDGWYCCLFVLGMTLCDIDLLAARDELPPVFDYLKPISGWYFYITLPVGILLGNVPSLTVDIERLRRQPGWYLLSYLKPQAAFDARNFFRVVAAFLMMISIPRFRRLKGFFEWWFCQYLGKISFSLYLIHGPVLWSIGDRVYAAVGCTSENQLKYIPGWMDIFALPRWGIYGLEVNYLIAQMLMLPLTCYVAEVATKLFDEPSNQFARWIFSRTIEPRRSG